MKSSSRISPGCTGPSGSPSGSSMSEKSIFPAFRSSMVMVITAPYPW